MLRQLGDYTPSDSDITDSGTRADSRSDKSIEIQEPNINDSIPARNTPLAAMHDMLVKSGIQVGIL